MKREKGSPKVYRVYKTFIVYTAVMVTIILLLIVKGLQ
jgi:hypothetical protein